jgi:hypothetical protein
MQQREILAGMVQTTTVFTRITNHQVAVYNGLTAILDQAGHPRVILESSGQEGQCHIKVIKTIQDNMPIIQMPACSIREGLCRDKMQWMDMGGKIQS